MAKIYFAAVKIYSIIVQMGPIYILFFFISLVLGIILAK